MLIPQWMWFAYLLWNAYPHHQSETSAVFGQEHPAILARFCDPSEGTWQRKMWWSSRVSVAKWAEIRLVSDIQWWIFVDRVRGFIRHIPRTTHGFLQWQNCSFHALWTCAETIVNLQMILIQLYSCFFRVRKITPDSPQWSDNLPQTTCTIPTHSPMAIPIDFFWFQ